MSTHSDTAVSSERLDLSKWRSVPMILMVVGGIGAVAGAVLNVKQFAFSWLLAYMFFLSLCLGGLGFTILHHLFDAAWSVPIRRIMEQMGSLLRWMVPLWIPIGVFGPKYIFSWMQHAPDLATKAKYPLFTTSGFYIASIACLIVWYWLSSQLKKWSLEQDKTGAAICTRKMRFHSAYGVFLFGFSLTMAAIMWMKALEHEWFSTMYGVTYFAGSMWVSIATIYVLTLLLQRTGALQGYVHAKQYYFIGSILFAFTVFYAYVTFAQYFIIWNANMPEETFWYVLREKGTWWDIGQIIIFGHFFVPFLFLLRIDWKLKIGVMGPLIMWVWLMHFNDMSFQIMPALHKDNYHLALTDIACVMFFGGLLANRFIANLSAAPVMPQNDPRFAESQDIYVTSRRGGDSFVQAATSRGIHHNEGGGH